MKQICVTILLSATLFFSVNAQNIGIGTTTPAASAQLDVSSTNKGILIPRMTTAQRTAITLPAKGLLVFDNDANGFWFFNGLNWVSMAAGAALTLPYQQSVNHAGYAFDITNQGNGGALKGFASTASGVGVYGETSNGTGVRGYANNAGSIAVSGSSLSGTGVRANSLSGLALDVVGNLKISGGNTNPTNGAVLTSDANGNATWQNSKVGFKAKGIYGSFSLFPASSGFRKLHLAAEAYDYGNNFTILASATPTQWSSTFLAPVDGLYHFDAATEVSNDPYDYFAQVTIALKRLRNGSTSTLASSGGAYAVTNGLGREASVMRISTDETLVAGDLIWIEIYQNSGEAVYFNSGSEETQFSGHLIWRN